MAEMTTGDRGATRRELKMPVAWFTILCAWLPLVSAASDTLVAAIYFGDCKLRQPAAERERERERERARESVVVSARVAGTVWLTSSVGQGTSTRR